ncbi:hypothetical protein [Planctomicrobium piriforme]|uniref:Uncharacterized protein n=1 Tax=Planctomicrobium piriforme TaxID=1576369 RepID=A0A1I3KZA6_9PLAN|nr:hypothetical protein [Planctomicrobium piriforme]SFI77750.1 hypothetical protein SAMN05421753_11288 [Planctomicrobium piriforme]
MQITIPQDVAETLLNRAEAAGFRTVDEYVLDLLAAPPAPKTSTSNAIEQLRKLRREVPRMSASEIVELVHEGRD